MEALVALLLVLFILYLLRDETLGKQPVLEPRGRLCDYYAAGSVFEDIDKALARGVRLLEVHVYSDEQDQPVVGLDPSDYMSRNISFEQVCVQLVNDAFPSKDPFVLSIVSHTDKTIVMNRVAEHLQMTLRRHLFKTERDISNAPLDVLANKLILVSGGTVMGTDLEKMLNLSWSTQTFRRLAYHEVLHPRDESDLVAFNKDHITLVAPDVEMKRLSANPERPKALGCQWNLWDRNGGGGFEPRPAYTNPFLRV